MFWKLVKYEWNAMMRKMLPVYIAAAVIAVINGFLWGNTEQNLLARLPEWLFYLLQFAGMLLYFSVLVCLCAVTFLFIAERFYKGLLKDEGYLMFTLPVRIWQLAVSKALVALMTVFLSGIVGILAVCLLGIADPVSLLEIPREIAADVRELFSEGNGVLVPGTGLHIFLIAAELLLLMLISGFEMIYHFYFSMSLGQLNRTHRVLWSVIWYIVISAVLSAADWSLLMLLSGMLTISAETSEWIKNTLYSIAGSEAGISMLAAEIVFLVLLVWKGIRLTVEVIPTHWILEHRLNLE